MAETPYAVGAADAAAAPDVGDSPRYDEAGLGSGYDAGIDALAAEDQLPTRQESRAATWGDSPEYGEADLAAEYDGDLDALVGEDQLPTRQESRAATWGDSPEYEEADLAAEYDGDFDALTAADRNPYADQEAAPGTWDNPASGQHAQRRPDIEDASQESASPEVPEAGRTVSEDGGYEPDTASGVTGTGNSVEATANLTTGPGLQRFAGERERGAADEAMPDEGRDAASAGAETPGQSSGESADGSKASRPEADRSPLSAGERIAELEARLERLERDRQAEPGTEYIDRFNESAQQEENRSETRRWQLPSDTRLGLGATVVGNALGLAAEHMTTAPGQVLGYVGMAVSTAVGVVAVLRENRKSKNERGSEDRGPDADDDRSRSPRRAT